MAALNTLRNKGGVILAIVIGIALLAFLLGDFLPASNNLFNSRMNVGEINGEKITYAQYSNQVEYLTQVQGIMSGNSTSSQEDNEQIRQQAWEQLVSDYAFNPGLNKMGITVSDAEQIDMVEGKFISPIVASMFVNPETGMFDKNLVRNFVANLDANGGEARILWNYIENQIIQERMLTKFVALVTNSIYVTDFETAQGVQNDDNLYNARLTTLTYASIPDSTVKIDNDELRKFYDNHKQLFKQVASRDIEYVVFDLLPSEQDYAEAQKYIDEIAGEFAVAEDVQQFASLNSQETPDAAYYKESDLETNLAAFAFNAGKEAMYGPVLDGDHYLLVRVSDTKNLSDTMGARHILLAQGAPAEQKDSIITALKKGADFAELANKYSMDRNANKNGGDLGHFTLNQFIPEVALPIFKAQKGQIIEVNSKYGTHIIEVTYKGPEYKKVQLASIVYKVDPSNTTQQHIYSNANKFLTAAGNSTESYNNAVIENALSKRVARVRANDRNITGLDNSREVITWAFRNEGNPISGILEVDGNYVIASVTGSREDGIAPFDQVKTDIRPMVLLEKKGAILAEKLRGATSLEEVAAKVGSNVTEAEGLEFNAFYIPEVGVDPALIGAICSGLEPGKLSKPVIGNAGVYLFEITAKDSKQMATPESVKVKLQANAGSYLTERMLQALYDISNIKDKRVKFF